MNVDVTTITHRLRCVLLGRRMADTYEASELSSTHLVMRTSEGWFPMETSYTWERVEGGARE